MVEAELTGEDGEFQGVQTGFAVPDDELGAGHDLFPADVTRQRVGTAIKFRVVVTSFCTLALHLPDPAVLHQARGIHALLLPAFQGGFHEQHQLFLPVFLGFRSQAFQHLVELIQLEGQRQNGTEVEFEGRQDPFQPSVVAAGRGRQLGILFPNPAQSGPG